MLKRTIIGLTLAAALASAAAAQQKGPNGGTVVKVDDHPIEFVQRGQEIVFYLGDHDGKPLPTKGLQGRAVLQDGGKTSTITLTPTAPNLLVGNLQAPLGSKARIVFSTRADGHTLQARFVTD
jgi:hypothetical protein